MKRLLIAIFSFFPLTASAAPGDNFRPCQTFTLAATTSSSNVSVSACGSPTLQVECYNSGSVTVYITGGNGSTTAASVPTSTPAYNGYFLPPGVDKVFDLGFASYLAAITASSTATIVCSSGFGQ